jgi:hypothetical protein
MRGHVIAAFRASAGGSLLALAAACGVPWLAAAAIRARWPAPGLNVRIGMWAGIGLAAVTVLQWGWRLLFGL